MLKYRTCSGISTQPCSTPAGITTTSPAATVRRSPPMNVARELGPTATFTTSESAARGTGPSISVPVISTPVPDKHVIDLGDQRVRDAGDGLAGGRLARALRQHADADVELADVDDFDLPIRTAVGRRDHGVDVGLKTSTAGRGAWAKPSAGIASAAKLAAAEERLRPRFVLHIIVAPSPIFADSRRTGSRRNAP